MIFFEVIVLQGFRLLSIISLTASAIALSGCLARDFKSLRTKSPNTKNAAAAQSPAANADQRNSETAYVSSRQFAVFDPKFDFVKDGKTSAAAMADLFPVRENDGSEIADLDNGADFLSARIDLLDSAQKTVDIQLLVWHGDDAGWKLTEKILALKARGVTVRLIVDPVNNIERSAQSMFFKMKQSGILLEGWETMYLYVLNMYRPSDTLSSFIDEGNRRYHEKMFIVDSGTPNAHAIVGGTNIGNKYFRLDPRKPTEMWRDKDVIIKGPVVSDVQKMFDANWQAIQEFRNNRAIFNTDPIWVWANYARDVLKLSPLNPIDTPTYDPVVVANYNAALAKPRNLQWHASTVRYLHSRPKFNEKYIHAAYLDFINSAKSEILLLNSYFLPLPDMQLALRNAVKRGVNVKIITNGREINDFPITTTAGRTLYSSLLFTNQADNPNNAKIAIYEWQGHPVLNNKEGLHHGKYAVFDRKAAIVGSFNIDPRSTNLNSECVVAFENTQLAETLAQEFETFTDSKFSENISYQKALTFTDPDGLRAKLETFFAVTFQDNL